MVTFYISLVTGGEREDCVQDNCFTIFDLTKNYQDYKE